MGKNYTSSYEEDHSEHDMSKKENIVKDWLPRYTGRKLEDFGEFILLTNFIGYVEKFAERFGVEVDGRDKPMQTATADNITIINFGMGSAMAATVMDLLSAIEIKALLFLGKCGGLKKKNELGSFVLPIAAIRGEGTSNDYLPSEVPALPSFRIHKSASIVIRNHELNYYTGTVYTTNRRVWEHDTSFKKYLEDMRVMAIDMETATIFTVGFVNEIPRGAVLMVSDNPMIPEGVKTSKSDSSVTAKFAERHLQVGIETLQRIAQSGESMKHMRFE